MRVQEGGRGKVFSLTDRQTDGERERVRQSRGCKKRESISVCVPGRVQPTHQPHDHRGLMGTSNPEALHSPI